MEMEEGSKKEQNRPQLLDLIPKDREWLVRREEESRNHGCSEEKKLELRLGLPGQDESPFSIGYFSGNNGSHTHKFSSSEKQQGLSSPWSSKNYHGNMQQQNRPQTEASLFLQLQSTQPSSCSKMVDLQTAEKKAFSPSSANTTVPNISQKRTAPAPVVGWPPIRSSRRIIASSSSSKSASDSQNVDLNKISSEEKNRGENGGKGLFVKINMDGVPIGRKVDLNAYDSYDKLSSAVDELFRGLLAAQRDTTADGVQNKKQEEEKPIAGLLDGSGEYTLVYEDNEGDRMLAGDVPWPMFVSTVKRLRVLKSSELTSLSLGSSRPEKMALDKAMK